METALDYLVAAETAFFSDDGRVSLIRIFRKITLKKIGEGEIQEEPRGSFAISGKITGNYGKGINLQLLHSIKGEIITKIFIEAEEKQKEFFNFIAVMSNIPLVEGSYSVMVEVLNADDEVTTLDTKDIFDVIAA